MRKDQRGSHIIAIFFAIVAVAAIGFVGMRVMSNKKISLTNSNDSKEATEGLSGWKTECTGNGTVTMQHSPIDLKDVGSILPMGMLAGAHVTPIDHLYYYPKDMRNRDAAPVYAMADGYIVDYSVRTMNVDSGSSKQGEYRIVMQHTCSFYSYYDLMTSMDEGLKAKLESGEKHVAIKAGQEVGRVGAQSLDTAIYNFDITLPGFINPDNYKAESWKIHTDDFFKYFNEPLLTQMKELNPRKVEPFGGKIDYDIAGKLRGNWFQEGTNGYAGPKEYQNGRHSEGGKGYWNGHLSIAPEAIDPTKLAISVGYYETKAEQFIALSPLPDPAEVGVANGAVKYELTEYKILGGLPYEEILNMTKQLSKTVKGTIMLQVLEGDKLKMELFPGKTASQVTDFGANAKTYVR